MKVFIGCSSREEIPEEYKKDCKDYLEKIFEENNDLVFGADNKGFMGLSYETAQKFERKIIGICPELYKKDFENLNCTTEIIAKNVGERTDEMIKNSDALVFLPGGLGTVYELFTAIETKRSHEHAKPIIIYNSCDYFDRLIKLLEKMYDENFTAEKYKEVYYISNSAEDTINYIKNYYSKEKNYQRKIK